MRLVGALSLALLLFLVLIGVVSVTSRQSPAVARSSALDTPIWLGNPIAGEEYAARHVWDLQVWRGRVYLGYGDWIGNSGPVDIWYYTPTASCFLSETVYVSPTRPAAQVDEEAIHRYVVIDADLYIPGTDPTESWDWGNLYQNGGDGWEKKRTIPNGLHVFDLASYSGDLFAAIGPTRTMPLLRSSDGGLTWTQVVTITDAGYTRFYNLYELDGTLFAVKRPTDAYTKPMVYHYQSSRFVSTAVQLVPDRTDTPIVVYDDMVPFGDTVLYVPWYWNGHISSTWPLTALYVIRPDQDGQPVSFFDGRHPRDIAVADGLVYVLDAGGPREVWDQELPDPAGYTATIHASMNLTGWIPVATAHFTDTPNALEVLDGVAYIGTYGGDVYALPLRYYCTCLPLAARN